MRLRRLDLTRYGKFTDHSIDFGERRSGMPDLHIVYGPNEAGKSTTLSAFLDMLFGVESRSRFNFLHPYPVLRIGACLEFAGRDHELVRIKRPQNDLLDAGGAPIADALLAGPLGGIDRESYRAMFSLDDETLEAGGESILASKGDLGHLLFSASTGLADLSQALTRMRAEADGFYKYHARAGELSNLKAQLAALKEQREHIDTVATGYAQLIEVRDRALAKYGDAIEARSTVQSRIDEIRRYVSALPRLAALRSAREQLLPLAHLPVAPNLWNATLPKLQENEITLAVKSVEIERDLTQKSAELDAIVIDDAALKVADRVDRWVGLHARYVTANDIPLRRLEVRDTDLVIAGLLARIGRESETNPQRLIFDAVTVGTLQDLIAKHSGIETATANATQELSEATHRLKTASIRLSEAGGGTGATPENPVALTKLAALVATLHATDHAARHRIAEREQTRFGEELSDQLAVLQPWTGDVEQLASTTVPDQSEILQWKTALAAAQKQHDQREAEVERLQSERLQLEAERSALSQVTGVVSDQDAGCIRSTRETAWAAHRRAFDAASADIFEAALRRDDIIMEARLRHEADIAKLQQTNHRHAIVQADETRTQALFQIAITKLQQIHDQIAAAVAPFLPVTTSIVQFERWLEKRSKALEIRANLRQIERDLRDAQTDADDTRQKLLCTLDAIGTPYDADATEDALRTTAQEALDREASLKVLRTAVEEHRKDVTVRTRNLSTAQQLVQNWHKAWLKSCSNCWLQEMDLSPVTVREILTAVSLLEAQLEKRASLNNRIDQMQDDQRAFASEVTTIAQELGITADNHDPLDIAQTIADRVQTARTARTVRAAKSQSLQESRERQRELEAAQTLHDKRKAEMTVFFNVTSLAEVTTSLSDLQTKAVLQAQADAAEKEILDSLRLFSIQEAESSLDAADRAALEEELVQLQARFEDQDQRTRDLFSAHSKAADQVEAVGGDAAVAKIEEQRRTILLEIEEGAIRYLKLRVGIVAAEHALRAYRQNHRSSMMAYASEAFQTISRNAYSGLASQPNKENEILIAVAADGSSKLASELSKGTRFQLYLSLRVAGYHEFARHRPPVPFIADDIMETFDDFRAEEAFRLMASMGEVGQVIYLTHHRHLCDIARRIWPDVWVHDLSPIPPRDRLNKSLDHSDAVRSRKALPITDTELSAMASAATSGLSRIPNAG